MMVLDSEEGHMSKESKRLSAAITIIHRICTYTAGISIAVTIVVVLIVVGNVFGRYVFRQPLLGTVELVQTLAVTLVFFVLAYTELKGGHVSVDLLVSRLPRPTQSILGFIMSLLSAVLAGFIFWQGLSMGLRDLFPVPVTTVTLSIPTAPFLFCMSFGSLLFALALLIRSVRYLVPEELDKNTETRSTI
jgi:TRAP-type C4-dicarboxylate transport system permease small subunit